MEAKKKASELVEKFKPHADWNNDYGSAEKEANVKHAKNCAKVLVDEILDNWIGYTGPEYYSCNRDEIQCDEDYWQKVKEEINKL